MNKDKIKGLLLLLVIIILIFVLVFINIDFKDTKALDTTETEEETEISDENAEVIMNENKTVGETQKVGKLEFSDAVIVYREGIGSIIELYVTNTTDDFYELKGFTILVYNKDGEHIDTITSDLYKSMAPKEKSFYNLESKKDLSKEAYTLEYIVSSQI